MENTKESILGFMNTKGPVIPADIAKHINSNILMASAHLSELSSNGKVKISNVKVGGTPLYFLPGQESQLQKFSDNLHEKEKKAYDLLLQKKILRDHELEPVVRVALRAIKDYAVPLQVNFKGNSEIFWRWYLFTNKEAEESIRSVLKEVEVKEKPTPDETEIQKRIEPQPVEQKTPQQPKKVEKKPTKTDNNLFLTNISHYFNKHKINMLSKEMIRKTEMDFIVQVPSAVGNLEYYCKSKNKKKINDSDLASAFAQGQLRKLPVLLITNGELTKRANEMLQKDFKRMSIIKL